MFIIELLIGICFSTITWLMVTFQFAIYSFEIARSWKLTSRPNFYGVVIAGVGSLLLTTTIVVVGWSVNEFFGTDSERITVHLLFGRSWGLLLWYLCVGISTAFLYFLVMGLVWGGYNACLALVKFPRWLLRKRDSDETPNE
jgi:hypothetical protein